MSHRDQCWQTAISGRASEEPEQHRPTSSGGLNRCRLRKRSRYVTAGARHSCIPGGFGTSGSLLAGAALDVPARERVRRRSGAGRRWASEPSPGPGLGPSPASCRHALPAPSVADWLSRGQQRVTSGSGHRSSAPWRDRAHAAHAGSQGGSRPRLERPRPTGGHGSTQSGSPGHRGSGDSAERHRAPLNGSTGHRDPASRCPRARRSIPRARPPERSLRSVSTRSRAPEPLARPSAAWPDLVAVGALSGAGSPSGGPDRGRHRDRPARRSRDRDRGYSADRRHGLQHRVGP